MIDNNLKILFNYKKPDEAVLITYKIWSVVKTYTGEKAIALYSELSGKTIEEIEKEAEK